MTAYYTICTRDGFVWYPQFGAYDRELVEMEREDSYGDYLPTCVRVVRSADTQESVDAACARLNMQDAQSREAGWTTSPYWAERPQFHKA